MSESAQSRTKGITLAIVAIAFSMYGQSICGPLIANIIMDCPEYPPTTIAMIQTWPTLGIIVSSICYGALSRRLSSRMLLAIATALFLIGGIVPIFLGTNIPAILVCRAILGLGCGVYSAMPASLIAEHYEANTGANVQGFVQASASAGTIVMQIASGWLATVDWRMSMWLTLICLVSLVLGFIFLPKSTHEAKGAEAAKLESEKRAAARKSLTFSEKYPPIVIAYFVEIFLFVGGIAALMMNAAIVIGAVGGTSVESGYALSVHTLIGFCAGLVFGIVFKRLKEYVLAVGAAIAAGAYLLIGNASDVMTITIGAGLLGVAAPWVCASFAQLIGKYSSPLAASMAVSISVGLQFFAQFLLAYWMPAVCNMLGMDAAAGFAPFKVYAVIYIALFVVFVIQAATGQKKRQAAVEAVAEPMLGE